MSNPSNSYGSEEKKEKKGLRKKNKPICCSIIHQNLCSIGNSIDKLQYFLNKHLCNVAFCASEHWKSEIQLENHVLKEYTLADSFCRTEGMHGGVAIYVKDGFEYVVCENIHHLSEAYNFKCCAVRLMLHNTKYIIVTVYRSPDASLQCFFGKLQCLLDTISQENCTIFLAGDFNIDIAKNDDQCSEFLSLMACYGLRPNFQDYTRITHRSKSIIDNIFSNTEDLKSEILDNHISDHTAQKVSFYTQVNKHNSTCTLRRIFSVENKLLFKEKLQEADWTRVFEHEGDDVDQQWQVFMHIFTTAFDACFPLTRVKNKARRHHFYSSPQIAECKRILDVLLVLKNSDDNFKKAYNELKIQYDKLLIKGRSQYYDQLIKSGNQSKGTWQVVNSILGRKKVKGEIEVSGNLNDVANDFNKYLTGVADSLLSVGNFDSLNNPTVNIVRNCKTFFLTPVNVRELVEVVAGLKNTMSSGSDSVPTSLLKCCIYEISEPLCSIINNSFVQGKFPKQLKMAVVIPVYKKGDRSLLENYRPISLLSSFSKVFEMTMCHRIVHFFNACNLFSTSQNGYLKGKSIDTAMFSFTQFILNSLEERCIPLGIFLDLSRAYDCVNHEILLEKLERYGIRGSALHWLRSYLLNRTQTVSLQKDKIQYRSKPDTLKHGIPQGSIAGPLLFVIYINDLANTFEDPEDMIVNYADDTNMIVKSGYFTDLAIKASDSLCRITNWFNENKLTLNKEKTKLILFKTNQAGFNTPSTINICNQKLNLDSSTRFLGIEIDEFLRWSDHVEKVNNRLNSACYSIRVLKKYVELTTLKTVYFANCQSVIKFGILTWGSSPDWARIFVSQKNIIRTMLGLSYRQSCRGHFRSLKIFTVTALYIYECLIFLRKNMHIFEQCRQGINVNTRAKDLKYPVHRLTLYERGTYYRCIKFYNKLPDNLKTMKSIREFKRYLGARLIELEPYSLDEYFSGF